MAANKLELRRLRKSFGAVPAVQDVTLSVPTGECIAFLGPSGCGKTTTLRMIAGFMAPSGGTIRLDGELIAGDGSYVPTHRRGIGMVFQSYALWPHKTVYQNVAYGLGLRKVGRSEERRRVEAALDLVQLKPFADRYPAMLSGGQQQRVSLARAIVVEPRLLLLDEPLSNLDARLREQMRFELKSLQKKTGLTTIYVTHDLAEAMVIADRIVVMSQGRVEQVGTPEELYARPRTRFVANFVGQANLIPGELVEAGAAEPRTILEGIGSFALAADAVPSQVERGQRGFLCVRPENVQLARGGAEGWKGRVLSRTYLGAQVEYEILLGQHPIRASLHPSHSFDPDEGVTVTVDRRSCSWLPA